MAIFNFRLQPIEQVVPWTGTTGPTLSWFGLSLGWYWLSPGDDELLRLREDPGDGLPPYVDYQVARLWEDVLSLLSAALEPVPEDIAARLDDLPRWDASVHRALLEAARPEGRASRDAADATFGWWRARRLDRTHLVHAPSVDIWRVGDAVHIAWAPHPEDQTIWASCRGSTSLSAEAFLEEVRVFDRDFLGAMAERVQAVIAAGGLQGIAIDLPHLAREQQDRSTWLASALNPGGTRRPEATDWAAVREHLARIESLSHS